MYIYIYIYTYIHTYVYVYVYISLSIVYSNSQTCNAFGIWDDTIGNPHRAQIYQFELFELILLLKFDKQFSVEQFEATVSCSQQYPPPS